VEIERIRFYNDAHAIRDPEVDAAVFDGGCRSTQESFDSHGN
jgi:hypothetical protein